MDLVALACCAEARCRGPEEWLYTYECCLRNFSVVVVFTNICKWLLRMYVLLSWLWVI